MLILKKIALILVVLLVVLAVAGLLLPRRAHVERSASIEAPRATVFALVNGFKSFSKWSPWAGKDPNARYTVEGPEAGVGSRLTWSGDPKTVGSGSQVIVVSHPYDTVVSGLDFGAQGKAKAAFHLSPDGTGTKVTWSCDMDLGMNPVNRYFGLMFDGMIGPEYEEGLANLKKLAEGLPKADFADLKAEVITVTPVTVAYVAAKSSQEEKAVASAIGVAYAQVGKFLASEKLKMAGAPLTINTKWGDGEYEFEAAIPVDKMPERPVPTSSAVQVKATWAGRAIKVEHKGPYHDLPETYAKMYAYAAASGHDAAGPTWDEYVSDPGSTPETDVVTNIYLPIR